MRPDDEDSAELLSRAKILEWEGWKLLKQGYGMNCGQFCVSELLSKVFHTADTNMCYVFNLHNTEPDAKSFKDALLECLLQGICRPEEDTKETLGLKVHHAVRWECDKILENILANQTLLKSADREEVLKTSFIEAIAINNVSAVEILLEDPAACCADA